VNTRTEFLPDGEPIEAESRFRLVVEGAPNAILMVDGSGTIVLANPQAERLFGYAPRELLGQSIDQLVPERYRGTHGDERSKFYHDPAARPMGKGRDLFGLRKDGSEVPIEIGLNPVNGESQVFVLASIVDLTARKDVENRLRAALREKEILLQEVHHRVKNNLQLITSLLKLQARQIQDEALRAVFQTSVDRIYAISLVHEQLYQQGDVSKLDCDTYLRGLMAAITRGLTDGSRRLICEVHTSGQALDISQAVPLGVIVHELVSNSLKHAFPPGGTGKITVTLRSDQDSNCDLLVADDGVGLPETFVVEQCQSMGLRLVNLLVRQMEGTLEVSKQPGAQFRVRFKFKPI
jgi:PAS domain S-box-containing protein